jgi:hypothetical protein
MQSSAPAQIGSETMIGTPGTGGSGWKTTVVIADSSEQPHSLQARTTNRYSPGDDLERQ